jgi:4-amino-4-deoxy-L-arabinose transferase-like glycosyltransferase
LYRDTQIEQNVCGAEPGSSFDSREAGRQRKGVPGRLAAILLFWIACVLLLFLSGAFTRELGGTPDEAAHYVTGLMIRDYVASGAAQAPMPFAENYYAHYPKVAFAIWPPLFHVMEAAWMLVVSSSKTSIFLLLACFATLLAYLLFRAVENAFGYTAGISAGLLFVSVPLVQESTHTVMIDLSVALFSFLAILRFGRYLDRGRWQDAAWFGIWSSAAVLSKYNGLALAFVPLFAAAFTRKWSILRRPATWLGAAIVLVFCGAWYLPMRRLVAYAAEPMPTPATILPAMRMNALALIGMMGLPLFLIASAGAGFALRGRNANRTSSGLWIASAAAIAGWWLFHSVVCPYPEPRYLLALLAPMILFLAAGVAGLARLAGRPGALVAVLAAALYLAFSFTLVRTPRLGYSDVADAIISRPDLAGAIVMADGTAESEGMSVSEIAIREHRPGHYVLRGSKVLADSTWMGANYRSLYQDTKGVLQALDRAKVSVVILEADSSASPPHHKLLGEALRSARETWQRWYDGRWNGSQAFFTVYCRRQPVDSDAYIRVPLRYTLHRDLFISTEGEGN